VLLDDHVSRVSYTQFPIDALSSRKIFPGAETRLLTCAPSLAVSKQDCAARPQRLHKLPASVSRLFRVPDFDRESPHDKVE